MVREYIRPVTCSDNSIAYEGICLGYIGRVQSPQSYAVETTRPHCKMDVSAKRTMSIISV